MDEKREENHAGHIYHNPSSQPFIPIPNARLPAAWETSHSTNTHWGPPKNPHAVGGGETWLLVQEQLLLLSALTTQQQLQNTPQEKALPQWCNPITSRGHFPAEVTLWPSDHRSSRHGDACAWESRKGALHSQDFQSHNHTSNKTTSSDKLINI